MNMTTHKIKITPDNDDDFLTWNNCLIFIDGKQMVGVKNFKFDIGVGGMCLCVLEFYPGEIEIEGLEVHPGQEIKVDFMKELSEM